jgi:hypothetical protein
MSHAQAFPLMRVLEYCISRVPLNLVGGGLLDADALVEGEAYLLLCTLWTS